MFEYILREYKESGGNQSFVAAMKKLSVRVRVLFFTSMALLFGGAVLSFLGIEIGLLLLAPAIIMIIVTVLYHEKKTSRQRETLLDDFLLKRIDPLIALLKNERRSGEINVAQYDLYNPESIEWLIKRCEKMLKPGEDRSMAMFMKVAYPVVTLIIGAMLRDASIEIIAVVFLVVVTIIVVVYVLSEMLDMLLGTDKRIAKQLMQDLEYLQTVLPKDATTQDSLQYPYQL